MGAEGQLSAEALSTEIVEILKESEWFEGLYRHPQFTQIIENDYELGRMLRKRSLFRIIERSMEERGRFERLLGEKYEALSGQT